MKTPAVSIVMSVYNGMPYVPDAVESIFAQTLESWELIVVDDGSTDDTGAVLDRFAGHDTRLVVVHQSNTGRPAALNAGVELARSSLVARLDADDVALPRRLELQVARLASDSHLGVLGGAVVFIDSTGRGFAEAHYPADDHSVRTALVTTTPFVHSAVTMRREAFEEAGGYRPAFTDAEDLDLWLRIPRRFRLENLEEPVVRYRVHAEQASVRHLERQAVAGAAARRSAHGRASGYDPLHAAAELNETTLRASGVTAADVTEELVRNAVWLGKTLGRAGDRRAGDELLARAAAEARSRSGSAPLATFVFEQWSRRRLEEKRRVAAVTLTARALLEPIVRYWRDRASDAR